VLCCATHDALASGAPRLQVELVAAHAPVAHAAADDLRAGRTVFRTAGRSIVGIAYLVICLSLPHQARYRAHPMTHNQQATQDAAAFARVSPACHECSRCCHGHVYVHIDAHWVYDMCCTPQPAERLLGAGSHACRMSAMQVHARVARSGTWKPCAAAQRTASGCRVQRSRSYTRSL